MALRYGDLAHQDSGLRYGDLEHQTLSEPPAGPAITNVTTIRRGESFVITLTGGSASGNTVTLGGVAQTITDESETEITCTNVLGDNRLLTDLDLVVENASEEESDPETVQVQPRTGGKGVTLSGYDAEGDYDKIKATPALEDGNQVEYYGVQQVGTGYTVTIADITVNADGSIELSQEAGDWLDGDESREISFQAVAHDGTEWGTPATQDVETEEEPADPGDVSFDGPNIDNFDGEQVGQALTPLDVSGRFSDTENETLTFSPLGTWPNGVTVTSAGVIQGTPTEEGTFSNLAVRATNESNNTADSNSFSITVDPEPEAQVTFDGPEIDDLALRTDITDDTLDVSGRFSDSLEEELTFSLVTLSGTIPTGVSIDPNTGVITLQPTADGSAVVVVRAENESEETADSNQFTIAAAANQAPEFGRAAPLTVNVNQGSGTQNVNLPALLQLADPEGDAITAYALDFSQSEDDALPDGWSFDTETGVVTVDRTTLASIEGLRMTATDEHSAQSDPSPEVEINVVEPPERKGRPPGVGLVRGLGLMRG